jgi:hypothetical protein
MYMYGSALLQYPSSCAFFGARRRRPTMITIRTITEYFIVVLIMSASATALVHPAAGKDQGGLQPL